MNASKITLLLLSLVFFGCADNGPATPPEEGAPAPSEEATGEEAPQLEFNDDGGGN